MNTLKLLSFALLFGIVFTACEKENLEETITKEEDVAIEIEEVDPGQAVVEIRGGSLEEEMRFDSAYFFTRVENNVTQWFFNAEFSERTGEAFFLDFTSESFAPGTYQIAQFDIQEFEDIAPEDSFAGEYSGNNLSMEITIDAVDEATGVTGTMKGSIESANGTRELVGRFVEVPIN